MKTTSRTRNRTKTPTQPPAINTQATQVIRFEFNDPSARKVCLAGTFNDWHPEVSEMISLGSGHWVKDLDLPLGAYEYRLVVDGQWITDPTCSRSAPNPFGETNSLLLVTREADADPASRDARHYLTSGTLRQKRAKS